jgi:hypothetical protein
MPVVGIRSDKRSRIRLQPSQDTPPPSLRRDTPLPSPTADPVTTVMANLPADRGDTGTFLVSYAAAYIAVDALAASVGLPPPFITAALASGAIVGAKNILQSLFASPSKGALEPVW